jgi:glutathione S-transferase
MNKIFLYENIHAFHSARARLALTESDIFYISINVDIFSSNESLLPKFLELNPDGSVPILVHGDVKLTDSVDIVRYVDLLGNHLGGDLVDKQLVDNWVSLIGRWDGNLFMYSNMNNKGVALFKTASSYRIKLCQTGMQVRPDLSDLYQQRIQGLKRCPTNEDIINNLVQLRLIVLRAEEQLRFTEYLAGDAYSMADVLMTVTLYCVNASGKLVDALQQCPNLCRYYQQMKLRPSFNTAFSHTAHPASPPQANCRLPHATEIIV